MELSDITPLILTYNESMNLEESLARLTWAQQVVVVDSCSDDETVEIANRFANVKVVQREFDSHTEQWNFGLEQVETTWVLAMDADYRCTSELVDEVASLVKPVDAYLIPFRFAIFGKQLRSSIYPPRVSLFRKSKFRYETDGHTQLLKISMDQTVENLTGYFIHDDRKPINRWIKSQCSYADLELEKLMSSDVRSLHWKDRIRTFAVFAPGLTLIYCLFFKLLILDGWAGLYYTLQRVIAEAILSLKIIDHRLRHKRESQAK